MRLIIKINNSAVSLDLSSILFKMQLKLDLVNRHIDKKVPDSRGYISKEYALILLAKDLGVDLLKRDELLH